MMSHGIVIFILVAEVLTQKETSFDRVKDLNETLAKIFGNVAAKTNTGVDEKVTKADNDFCVTDNGEKGKCVPYYLCTSNGTIVTDGYGIIDIRRSRDEPCLSYLDTCCLEPNRRNPEELVTPKEDPVLSGRTGCGWRNPKGIGFQITGASDGEAQFGEFPWMVAILQITSEPNGIKSYIYMGGGSLIHPSIVLTAAHYVAEISAVRVRAGEWDTKTESEIYPHQNRDVVEVIIHKDFNKGNLFYDVALLLLSSPINDAPNVKTACLPPPGHHVAQGTRCLASGWGKDKFGEEGRYQLILKKVEVPVVERDVCEKKLQTTRLGKFFKLHSSFMCAGGESQDTCSGDGGSPLVCPIKDKKDRYMQSGIVAWGVGCGTKSPGVYVDVSNFREWIDEKVTGKGYSVDTYTFA